MAVGTINLGKFWAISGKYLGIRSMYFLVTYLTWEQAPLTDTAGPMKRSSDIFTHVTYFLVCNVSFLMWAVWKKSWSWHDYFNQNLWTPSFFSLSFLFWWDTCRSWHRRKFSPTLAVSLFRRVHSSGRVANLMYAKEGKAHTMCMRRVFFIMKCKILLKKQWMAVVLIIANIGTNINMTSMGISRLSLREWFSWYNKYDKDNKACLVMATVISVGQTYTDFNQLFLFFFSSYIWIIISTKFFGTVTYPFSLHYQSWSKFELRLKNEYGTWLPQNVSILSILNTFWPRPHYPYVLLNVSLWWNLRNAGKDYRSA